MSTRCSIVIDNSDIAKPVGRKLEALAKIRDGSTGEITQGYLTIEAAMLSEAGNTPLPVYKKFFSATEEGLISEAYENLCCLENLSSNFRRRCVRTLDREFDANEFYHYFLKHNERFVIRAKKNRNAIYNGKTLHCKMGCIPIRLCEFPAEQLGETRKISIQKTKWIISI